MKRKTVILSIILVIISFACKGIEKTLTERQTPTNTGTSWSGNNMKDWPIPAVAGTGKKWELQESQSDDFKYLFNPHGNMTSFGGGKWYNFYHNPWDGPGTTYWKHDHVSVDGESLVLEVSRSEDTRKMNQPGVNAGCVTSHSQVLYPVFIEACISVANITLASDVWLLSPDDTQEIDIIECYGGAYNGNSFFANYIHLSHHSFIRSPFADYQPKDQHSWWSRSDVNSWGNYSWNVGNRNFVRIGVYWIDPFHFEYYIDGELVRVLYHNALATKIEGRWYYNYPTKTNESLDFTNGYQKMIQMATNTTPYDYNLLLSTNNISSVSVIDPYNYQNGTGMCKPMDIIINIESQDWHVTEGRTPTDSQLDNRSMNTMKVDWLRVYKPVSK